MYSDTSSLSDERLRILDFTGEKFFAEGFYKTTIDEIARELRISKNTIYKFFPTKENLLLAVIKNTVHKLGSDVRVLLESEENALAKFVNMLGLLSKTMMRFSERWLKDLQIHAPHIWAEVDKIRQEIMYGNLKKIIEQGKKEKLFYDYPTEVIILIFISSIRAIINPQFLLSMKYTYTETVRMTFEILLNGILTDRGKVMFKKLNLPQ
jgi:AcrR family transcriptional regulator